jgi:hypothetical protein
MSEAGKRLRPTDWRRRFDEARPARTVIVPSRFAGIPAGATLFIASPGVIANYAGAIPPGETRSVEQMRRELARRNGADATCPVTTALYLRIVAEVALRDLEAGPRGTASSRSGG